ncbi:Asp-tRNA(Asn)/Glu-tRNA(Gln) amidotransferase subunit GatC [Candidatus Micrarchaeota archaeon]|nr:Asp-tRNA(Asn)/Glu-tRNA(Gln) amidotransferase subunit GatC [Candidatus Micrarchaeota archaeon]
MIELKETGMKKELERIAAQQRLQLSEEEAGKFAPQLEEITKAFSELDRVDTSNTKPSFHPIEIETIFREDEAQTPSKPTENHQRKEKGYLKGPRILK